MHLLYVTNGISGSGGLERVLSLKTNYLINKLNYKISILGFDEPNKPCFFEFNKAIRIQKINFNRSFPLNIFSYIFGIREFVSSAKPDIIIVCDDGFKAFFLPFVIGFKKPIVYERHVSKQIEFFQIQTLINRVSVHCKWVLMNFFARFFTKFILLTPNNLKEWTYLNNIEIIPNPLPFTSTKSSGLNNQKVIAVGRQNYQKGFDLLVNAWEIVHSNYPEWVLEVFGKKDLKLKLDELVLSKKLQNVIFFNEPNKNIENEYLNASIFVLSSRFEGFGMVLIEAMSFGVPCVSFDCPHGPGDIINHNINGLLVENGNVRELANSICELISDNERRKLLGSQAKIDVNKYNIDVIMTKWDTLFKSLSK
jgi:glycosyltransferase involved in cell wall biosynthesis